MDIRYTELTKEILALEERIKNLSLAYKMVLDHGAPEPAIVDGSDEYIGIEAMQSYIDKLDREKGQWYFCV